MTDQTEIVEALLLDLARAIAGQPDRVRVERRTPTPGETLWWLSCAPEDQGRFIGRSGAHARAFDVVVGAMGEAVGEDWRFKLDSVPGLAREALPVNRPDRHDPRGDEEMLARLLQQIPCGLVRAESKRNGDASSFTFDVHTSNAAAFFARRDPDDPESNLVGAVGTLFRAIARASGVRYQINVIPV